MEARLPPHLHSRASHFYGDAMKFRFVTRLLERLLARRIAQDIIAQLIVGRPADQSGDVIVIREKEAACALCQMTESRGGMEDFIAMDGDQVSQKRTVVRR